MCNVAVVETGAETKLGIHWESNPGMYSPWASTQPPRHHRHCLSPPVLHVREDDGQGLVHVDDDLQVGRKVPLRPETGNAIIRKTQRPIFFARNFNLNNQARYFAGTH